MQPAVLLLAHGSPDSVDEVPEFLLNVTNGRPVPVQVIEEVKLRYSSIGRSPLTALTLKQGELLSRELGTQLPVSCTAHSVPQRTIAEGDPYEEQSRETAALVACEASIPSEEWKFAFQSQGMSGGAWVGPTVEDTILELRKAGYRGVFVQPIGFLCDHVEVLYDIDIGFRQFAEKQGLRLWRAESLND